MKQVITYSKGDWEKFYAYLEKDLCLSTKMWYEALWFKTILWLIVVSVFFVFFQSNREFSWPTASIVAFIFLSIFGQAVLGGIKFKSLCAPREDGTFIGEHRFTFDDESILSEGKGYRATYDWSVVKRIAQTDGAIYLFLDNANAFIFPWSQLENPETFYSYLSSQTVNTRANEAANKK